MHRFSTYLPLASSSHFPLTNIFKDFCELMSEEWDFYCRGRIFTTDCRQGVRQMCNRSNSDVFLDDLDQGRPEAFEKIVREHDVPLRGYLAKHAYHSEDVDDLAQEVFLAALGSLSSFRRGDDFGAWLRGIAHNKLLVYFRSKARHQQALLRFRDEVVAMIGDDFERGASGDRAEAIERLLQCIEKLPKRLQRVVKAGLDGDKPSQLAAEFSTSIGVIYNLHYRAHQLLRECLRKETADRMSCSGVG
jgi:RNA polymerase sigma-70 factor (ECF subfamily)